MITKQKLETYFSPLLYEPSGNSDTIVVIIDILRATSSICTAFENGALEIIPVAEVEKAREYKSKGYLVAAERDGFVLDFADFGNSPFNFTKEKVEGKSIVYSTTNGTGIINQASSESTIIIGSFLNISALISFLKGEKKEVILFCAGWKSRFNLEDTIFAGAVAEQLMETGLFTTKCDSTIAAIDLWRLAKTNLAEYIDKAAQRNRLREKGLDDCLGFCLTMDYTKKIPVIKNGVLVDKML